MQETRHEEAPVADEASVEAIIEAGSAAVSAGATEAGVQSLRTAVRLADGTEVSRLRVESRLVLAEALVHSLWGFDEEGLAWLHEADEIALAHDHTAAMAQARSEIGYVGFLRARYDRAEVWLKDSSRLADRSPSMLAKASAYLGSVESDRANYVSALALLGEAVRLARTAADPRRESYARSMLGRIHFLRGDLDSAVEELDESINLAERHQWLAFVPWPQAFLGEVQLARSDVSGASELLEQAFARACQLGDPCWESLAARGLALVAEASDDADAAALLTVDVDNPRLDLLFALAPGRPVGQD